MKFRLLSDLHIEFSMYDIPELVDDKDTTLLLAGDIGIVHRKIELREFLEKASKQFHTVLWIFGNHEFYKGKIESTYRKAVQIFCDLDNVWALDDDDYIFDLDNVAVVGATLWTDLNKGNPLTMWDVGQSLTDYKQIRLGINNNYRKIRPIDTMGMHGNSKAFIFKKIAEHQEAGRKVLVMSHHAPSYASIHDHFKGDNLNAAYVSELHNEICEAEPNIWVHGHVHQPHDYMIGNTRILCNPRGYASEGEITNFDPLLTFVL